MFVFWIDAKCLHTCKKQANGTTKVKRNETTERTTKE